MSKAIEFQDVGFAYPGGGGRLSKVSFGLEAGTRLAVVGPNGAGKTTLLRLLTGTLVPSAGRVRILGFDPATTERAIMARRIAVVAAQVVVDFPFSVEEVVLMGRAPHAVGFGLESDADLEAAHAAMAAMEVEHLSDRLFESLSSGEKQRAAVARALAQSPEVLLLDEPGAFLDIKHQVALYDLLSQKVEQEGVTVVSVLHDLNLAALFFDRVAMVAQGTVYAEGPADEVISYANVRAVFDTDVYVDRNDLTGKLNVLPLPPSRRGEQRFN
jgi:iron complex transport system ATP-binding protein